MHFKKLIVSIVIPAYNEEKEIASCLLSLKKQTYKNFEILLVDDGSTDKTTEIVKKFKDVQLLLGAHKGPGVSRNLGAQQARGEILVFVDADMTFEKNYLKNLIAPLLQDKKILGTTHDQEIATNIQNIWASLWGKLRVNQKQNTSGAIFRAIRKNKFLDLGGFDPRYGYADDQTLLIKYNLRPITAENTLCYHNNPETLKEVYKQSRWIGASYRSSLFFLFPFNYLLPFLLTLLFPIILVPFCIKRSIKNKTFKHFFPWMFIFISVKYFGTIEGIVRKVYFNKNVR